MKNKISPLSNKNILVTGGAGFIGSNICRTLVNQDANVICLDNFLTGSRKNIVELADNPKFILFEGDIRSYEDCFKATNKIDFVLHQAALGSVPRSIKDPITTHEINVNGFLNILHASKENKVKRFVYAASSSTYGDSPELPKIEENIGNPLSPYAVTKYVNEQYASIYSKTYNVETIGLRYFNVFGPNQSPAGPYAAVIPKFVSQLMKGESPVINGDGTYSRDFTYVENVVQANILSLLASNKEALNQVYNIAYGNRNTLNDLVNYLKLYLAEFDKSILNIPITYGENRVGDIPHSHASIMKAKKYLNYNPKYNMQEGLRIAVNWYWNNL